jgi:hypothetical protein
MSRYAGRTITSRSAKNRPNDNCHELIWKRLPKLSMTVKEIAIEIRVQMAAIACFELIENSNMLTFVSLKQPFPKPSPNFLVAFPANKPILRKPTYVNEQNIPILQCQETDLRQMRLAITSDFPPLCNPARKTSHYPIIHMSL